MSRFRYILVFFSDIGLLPALLFCLFNADLVTYGLRMGKGQLSIVWGARDFEEVFADPQVSDSVKTKLHLIEEIKQFAYDSIGLKRSDNYTTFFDQKDQRLMYVVTGAERYELEAYTWSFPVVGEVPYKGFFDEEKARDEYYRLKMLGYDADVGGASGWSTLGWFKDPVLSSMLKRSEADLAELIIHELTHGTLFVKDSVEYNENLAQFVGVEGAKWYLQSKYGAGSKELLDYLASIEEEDQKSAFMLAQAVYLRECFAALDNTLPEAEKQRLKRKAFLQVWNNARTLELKSDSAFADRLLRKMSRSGNTMFLQYARYQAKQDDFYDEFEMCKNNLKLFVLNMVARYGR